MQHPKSSSAHLGLVPRLGFDVFFFLYFDTSWCEYFIAHLYCRSLTLFSHLKQQMMQNNWYIPSAWVKNRKAAQQWRLLSLVVYLLRLRKVNGIWISLQCVEVRSSKKSNVVFSEQKSWCVVIVVVMKVSLPSHRKILAWSFLMLSRTHAALRVIMQFSVTVERFYRKVQGIKWETTW